MTRIYTPKEIELGHMPTSKCLSDANFKINEVLVDLNEKSKILGASSYGSLAAPDKSGHISSDLDWIIVFESLEELANCQPLADLIIWLKNKHIDFSNPIISLDSIQNDNHIIAPILYSIKANTGRVVIGKDPVEFFDLKREKLLDVISRLFHTFTRYFYENLVNYPLTKDDIEVLIRLLQSALGFFLDTYRSMQIVHDNGEAPTNYQKYLEYYQGRLKDELLADGLKVNKFIGDYKDQIGRLVDSGDKSDMSEYISFINSSRDVIISSAKFCRGNIEFFRSSVNDKQD